MVFYHEQSREQLGHALIEKIAFSAETKRVYLDRPIPAKATFAMWDLPKARCTKRLFISPACDDLAQVSTVLALLRRLALSGARASFHALFTRAEEIGFAGAFASLRDAKALIKSRTRNFYYAPAEIASEDPILQQTVGHIAANAFAAETVVLAAAEALDRVAEARLSGHDINERAQEAAAAAAKSARPAPGCVRGRSRVAG